MFLTHIFYLLISSSFTRMLTYSKLKYIIIALSLTCDLPKYACTNFITRGPVTPVGPATITDTLLLLVFCDICSSSRSLSFESLDSILTSNFHYYFQDGRPSRY